MKSPYEEKHLKNTNQSTLTQSSTPPQTEDRWEPDKWQEGPLHPNGEILSFSTPFCKGYISFYCISGRRDTYKNATAIPTPSHLRDYISAGTLTPHDGSPIIATSAYMPQLHTKSQETLYIEILKWIQTDIVSEYPLVTALLDGDSQATP